MSRIVYPDGIVLAGGVLSQGGVLRPGGIASPAAAGTPELYAPLGVLPGKTVHSTLGRQWLRNGTPIPGETHQFLIIPWNATPGETFTQPNSNTLTVPGAMWDWSSGTLVRTGIANAFTTSRASTATYMNAAGVLSTAANNVPRIDHDPVTHAVRGLLTETQSTNLITYSEDLSNGVWGLLRGTITHAQPWLDGTNKSTKFVPDTTSNTHPWSRVSARVSTTAGSLYTDSFFVKPAGYSRIVYENNAGATGTYNNCVFDVTNGTILFQNTASFFSVAITVYPQGWYRACITFTSMATTTLDASIFVAHPTITNASSRTFAGDGVSGLYYCGRQTESNGPTSYIPTTAAAAVRQLDSLMTNTTGFDFSKGIFVADVGIVPSSLNLGGISREVFYTGNSTTERVNMRLTNGTLLYPMGLIGTGTAVAQQAASAGSPGTGERLTLSYSTAAGSYFARKTELGTVSVSANIGNFAGTAFGSFQISGLRGHHKRLYWLPLAADAAATQNIAAAS